MVACLASGKADLAAQLYQKIEKPDGYAMHQGIRAFCASGDLASAAEIIESQRRGFRLLSGHQMMLSYKCILHAALAQHDYETARRMFSDLLEKGYIPSKSILFSIIETKELNRRAGSQDLAVEDDVSRFHFFLFVLDSLEKRNLPTESILFVATLTLGGQLGGLPRKVASLLAQARTIVGAAQAEILSSPQDTSVVKAKLAQGWEELVNKYDTLPMEDILVEQLPLLPVRVAPRDVVRVLRAEQSVTYTAKRKVPQSRTKGPMQR